MTLEELRARLAARAIEADAQRATAPLGDTLRWLLAELATVNGTETASDSRPRRLLKPKEAAERLGCSVRYLYAKAPTLPFTVRVGGLVRFSEPGLERWLAQGPR